MKVVHVYMHIYIYVCVCVCTCFLFCIQLHKERERGIFWVCYPFYVSQSRCSMVGFFFFPLSSFPPFPFFFLTVTGNERCFTFFFRCCSLCVLMLCAGLFPCLHAYHNHHQLYFLSRTP
ncbi:hypothetical protein, unlikely [Trypanosoma brucei gambiense DAL972]|uniref:Uncharacterized protein n=1 Tax=Trypanosoma brucei gambiense (strain MHOM/CI/86/DAL972) TaxID=679716 RepID=C9ZJF9_TRYB9|nr:hypothetical protein, unlikely [Trypanosoma brucei gambiense DAL972]CBH09518.1 hypothetical protein, unlikely [Trypanosoma brucei gambiense DAL972]|eukprot:XP_011771823.1 hypothetical protein, unlikely [Trypanosoma brucei gambiense DAL972]